MPDFEILVLRAVWSGQITPSQILNGTRNLTFCLQVRRCSREVNFSGKIGMLEVTLFEESDRERD